MNLLVIQPYGGLCNRLRTLASAKIFADVMERDLKVLWQAQQWVCPCQAEDLFVDLPTIKLNDVTSTSNLYYHLLDSSLVQYIENQNDKDKIIHIRSCRSFKPTVMTQVAFNSRYQKELQNLKPLPEIEKLVLTGVENMIGLQIRRSEHWRATRNSPLSYFIRVIGAHLEQEPCTRFFLCCESFSTKEYLKECYEEHIIFHMYERNSTFGMQFAFADLLSLSKTKLIYRSDSSSFGMMAHKLYETPMITLSVLKWPFVQKTSTRKKSYMQALHWNYDKEQWELKKTQAGILPLERFILFTHIWSRRFWYSKLYQRYISTFLPQHILITRIKKRFRQLLRRYRKIKNLRARQRP